MDVLSDIFDTIHLRGALYFRTDFSAPWGTTVPPLGRAARFHLCITGECHVTLPSGAHARLGPGDLILIPGGSSHVLSHAPGAAAPPLETVIASSGFRGEGVLAIGHGDAGAATRLVCGHLSFNPGADHPLLRALPEFLLITAGVRAGAPWLDRTLDLIAATIFAAEAGAIAAVTRLSEVVFIEALRAAAPAEPRIAAILAGLGDPQIGRALALIHEDVAADWTVETLARAAAMSRSSFAERFQALIGSGPMHYLAEWRLQRAMALLLAGRTRIGDVARRTGYASTTAFARAFRGRFGVTPSAVRTGGAERAR